MHILKKPTASIQIWPITDPMFAKDFASELQSALGKFGSERPKFGWSSNGSSLRGSRGTHDCISIEVSKHRFRFTQDRKTERFMNVHLPESVDPDEVLAVVRQAAHDFTQRRNRPEASTLNVSVKFPHSKQPFARPPLELKPLTLK